VKIPVPVQCVLPGIVRTNQEIASAGDSFDYPPQTGVESAKVFVRRLRSPRAKRR